MITLWQPPQDNAMRRFRDFAAKRFNAHLADYAALHRWSVENPEDFWLAFTESAHIPFLRPFEKVLEKQIPWRHSRWFPGAEINWAHMALGARRESDKTAIIALDEQGERATLSYSQLYKKTSAMAELLAAHGIGAGKRLAAFMPNSEETLIVLLAAVSRGATFSSTSPDFGVGAAADRLSQFAPDVLCAATHYFFKGKKISVVDKIVEIVARSPQTRTLVIFWADAAELELLGNALAGVTIVAANIAHESDAEIIFKPYGFSDPLYVMYSSGTTGLPKCIVQGHGVIINHMKEHMLHCGSGASDTIFYYTTCGWMMYNWLVSALCFGATVVLFDGNPFFPSADSLWKMAADRGVTVFGTSAKYLMTLAQENFDAREITRQSKIRAVLSTGSVLPPEGFTFVYEHIHETAQLSSISGGTDLNGCFALGNPDLPVTLGELQSRGLGMAVEIWNDAGESVVNETGELVCTEPFPSMPLGFLGDETGERYRSSYFERYPGRDVWAHGDFALLNERGGMVFGGRSDATLNPGGVRIGTAEIYRVLDLMPEIEDSLIIGRPKDEDEQVVLFVKLRSGELGDPLRDVIRKTIRDKVSPRHVPGAILQVSGVPYTINGKKVELAVKYIALGRPITNRETIANKEVLAEYEALLKS